MSNHEYPINTDERAPHQVVEVLSALGELMRGLHKQDLILQEAISKLAANAQTGAEIVPIQHIDFITQTHDDLRRFLPVLSKALADTNFDEAKLAKSLRLQSLRDALLGKDASTEAESFKSGDLSLF